MLNEFSQLTNVTQTKYSMFLFSSVHSLKNIISENIHIMLAQ